MKPEILSKSDIDKFQSILDYRKHYILEEAEYIKSKCNDIGLNYYYTLSELCFALLCKEMGAALMWKDWFTLSIEAENINRKLEIGDLLDKLSSYPEIIDRLNIDVDKRAEYLHEVVNELEDVIYKTIKDGENLKKPYKRLTPTIYIYHIAGKFFNEMTLQINPEIKAKHQVKFVQGIFADYKFSNYHCEDIHNTHFKAIETLRLRSLKQ